MSTDTEARDCILAAMDKLVRATVEAIADAMPELPDGPADSDFRAAMRQLDALEAVSLRLTETWEWMRGTVKRFMP